MTAAFAIALSLSACGGGSSGGGSGFFGGLPSGGSSGNNGAGSNTGNGGAGSAGNTGGDVAASLKLTQFVNPLIGTAASNSPDPVSTGKVGSVFPAAGLPSGMVQWAPDTTTVPATSSSQESGSPAGYYYDMNTIQGFSLTHMSGAGGQGNDGEFPVVPTTDLAQLVPTFQHGNETAGAGFYSVLLDNQVKVDLTATLRTGFGRFTYPNGQPAFVVIDGTRTNTHTTTTGTMTQLSATSLAGTTVGGGFERNGTPVNVYFYAEFDQPFASGSSFANGIAKLAFAPGSTVQMRIGISYVNAANAKDNLQKENPGWNFDAVKTAADAAWESRLETVKVTGGTTAARTKFYTAFYHALWAPSLFSDVNGQYVGLDSQIRSVSGHQTAQYSAFSGWDVYRSLIPLKAVLFPRETSDMMQSLVNDADQCGALPRWVNDNVETGTMVGDAGSMMVSGGYAFGAQDFDTQSALGHMIKMANVPGTSCNGASNGGRQTYLKFGYIQAGESGKASSTLEYASSDFAISRFAEALKDVTTQKVTLSRSSYWSNVVNTTINPPLVAGRESNGAWDTETPSSQDNYVQGDAEQYTWMVPHNPTELFTKLGGNAVVVPRLDSFFSTLNAGTSLPNFYMGNEPTFGVPWLYNWAGAPAKTQALVQRIMNEAFSTDPNGLPGNDDLGAVSGWYMWGALGLYPAVPGVGGFAVASPQFPGITVTLGNGKTLQINAPGAPDTNYIQSVKVNGQALTSPWLTLDAVSNGGTLDFAMDGMPSTWGTALADAPPAFGVPVAANVQDAFNNEAIGKDGLANTDGTGAALDGTLHAYSVTAMANAGLTLGAPFTVNGASFTIASAAPGLDNIVAVGQTVKLPAAAAGSSKLVLLGLSTNGPSTGTAVVNYTDGTTKSFTLGFDDGTLNGGGLPAPQLGTTAFKMTYRNNQDGTKDNTVSYIFAFTAPIDPTRQVASITLPGLLNQGRMHVFGISTAS